MLTLPNRLAKGKMQGLGTTKLDFGSNGFFGSNGILVDVKI